MRFFRERRRARLVSDYADSLIVRRREPAGAEADAPTKPREDSAELLDLVRTLDDLDIVAPAPPGTSPWLQREADGAGMPSSDARSLFTGLRLSFAGHPALGLGVLAVALVAAFSLRGSAPVSADDLLSESEAALEAMLGPGQGVYRLWDASYRVKEPNGTVTSWDAAIHEWIEGGQPHRTARRAIDPRGRLLWTMVVDRETDGQPRARMYYSPDHPVEPRRLVTIDATTSEHRQAAQEFPDDDRAAIGRFFLRSYGTGTVGERAYNRAILGTASAAPAEPVVSLSDDSVDGERLHRVQIFEPHRLWFTRASDGALAAMLVRYEQTRYISPDSRLTMKFVTRVRHDSGRETMTTWTTHTTHLRRLGPEDAQAFRFEPPAGVPVRRAAARDDLARMLPALRALRAETADTAPVPSDAGAPERR